MISCRFLCLTVLISFAISSCVTAPKPRRMKRSQTATSKEKVGTKSPQEESRAEAKVSPGEFFLKHSQPTTIFTSEDERVLTSLPSNPKPSSIEEAAIVMGVVKLAIKKSKTSSSSTEESSPALADTLSLEALALEKQVDLPNALANNNLLKNLVIFQQVVQALRLTKNSPLFVTNVRNVLDRQASQWTGQDANALFGDSAEDEMGSETQTAMRTSVADVRMGDSVLMEAQNLATVRQFKEAIAKASQVRTNSPLYPAAQEKIINFSTEAVQDLRRKAAQAFQNAIPVADPKARAAYLEEAKSHLEEALKSYPQAPSDQLSTVRENLAVITQDLERVTTADSQ